MSLRPFSRRSTIVALVAGVGVLGTVIGAGAMSSLVPLADREERPEGCPGSASLKQGFTLLTAEAPPPPPGTQLFDVVVPEVVGEGAPLSVMALTTRPQQPLEGVRVVLRDLDHVEYGSAVTGVDGRALLSAPDVGPPTPFFVEATKEGAANFIPAEDVRMLEGLDCAQGSYPANFVSVFPATAAAQADLRQEQKKFEIDEALGWSTAISFSELIDKASKGGFEADEDWWARRPDIGDHLKEKNGEDVYIFFGHGADTDGQTNTAEGIVGWSKFMWARGGRVKSIDAIVEDMKSDGNPPGIVTLAGCSTHSMLDKIVGASAKLAVGFTNTSSLSAIAGATKAFWEALLDGKTLGEAADAANAYLDKVGALFNPKGADLAFKGKAWVTRDMKLNDILTHER